MIFFKNKLNKRYTFNRNDYQNKIVFLKRLKSGKILYDNQIYDKDFFYYKKLKNYTKIFYIYQKKFIDYEFSKIIRNYNNNKSKMSFYQRFMQRPRVKYYNPKRKIIKNLTKEQYNILVKAFTFNFSYGNFDTKKLSYYLYRFGWFSIKPVHNIFKEPYFSHMNDYDEYEEEYDKYWHEGGLHLRTVSKRPLNLYERLKEGWFLGWNWRDDFFRIIGEEVDPDKEKDPKKAGYYLYMKNRYKYSKNKEDRDYYQFVYEEFTWGIKMDNIDDEPLILDVWKTFKEREVYDLHKLEYDPQKMYNEFDINSKTNTRYRYITYNDVYYKDYKGKKFPTESYFDYDEDEIKYNFDNMINGKGQEKTENALKLYKNITYLKEFLEILNDQYSERLNVLIRGYQICNSWHWLMKFGYHNKNFVYETESRFHNIIYDPRYILILPVLDAFFEQYRYDFELVEDNIKFDYYLKDYEFEWYEIQVCAIYLHTLEYKEKQGTQKIGYEHSCIYDDLHYDMTREEPWEEESETEYFMIFIFICTVAIVSYYTVLGLTDFFVNYYPYALTIPTEKINKIHEVHLEHFHEKKGPKIYFELANRKPRYIKKILPLKYYLDERYTYKFHHGRPRYDYPETIIEIIKRQWDNTDFSLKEMHIKLWEFGDMLGYGSGPRYDIWELINPKPKEKEK